MKKIPGKNKIGAVLAVCLIVAGLAVDYSFAKSDNIYDEIQRFDKVLIKIDRNYVEELNSGELVDAAIEGMREVLDPHTAYFEKSDFDELMVHTRAEFGGLGITISIRDKVLTVVSPLPGTPASMMGIMAGDRIIEIEGKSTKGITVDKAVQKLRGKPGTKVTITVEREGETEPIHYTITRDIINVKSVPYAGMLNDSIGYVRLISFSKKSAQEIETAIQKLKNNRLRGLVLDLRNNPGGLLPASIDVTSKILGKDKMVVYTRGRMRGQDKEYESSGKPVLDSDVPLVVLVNEGSASAAEIVSGAVQDWDRGVIMGRETYGKGSVQTVLPLGFGKDRYLKMTTAYYYTPSGRCINKPRNAVPDKAQEHDEEESAEKSDSSEADTTVERKEYKTKAGRTVYGGGGILPDVILEHRKWKRYEEVLERKSLFFKYAIVRIAEMKHKNIKITEDLKITDAELKRFKKFLKEEGLDYKTRSEIALEELMKSYQFEYGDSADEKSKSDANKQVKRLVKDLEKKLEKEKHTDFKRSSDYIKKAIKREILAGALGDEVRYHYTLNDDHQVQEAVNLLVDKEKYKKLLMVKK